MLYGTSKKFELIAAIKHYKLWRMAWWILKFKAEVDLKQSSNLLILLVPGQESVMLSIILIYIVIFITDYPLCY